MLNIDVWNKILSNLSTGRDFHTRPCNRTPIWFYAEVADKCIFVSNARSHSPSSNIKGNRKLSYEEFEKMYPVHLQREQGLKVSSTATKLSRNQVYWFGILGELL